MIIKKLKIRKMDKITDKCRNIILEITRKLMANNNIERNMIIKRIEITYIKVLAIQTNCRIIELQKQNSSNITNFIMSSIGRFNICKIINMICFSINFVRCASHTMEEIIKQGEITMKNFR
jgi:hypothetical protein